MNGTPNIYSPNFVEFITPPGKGGKFFLRKLGIVLLTALLSLGLLLLIMIRNQLAPLALFGIGGIAYLAWFLWRFTSVEYEYCVAQGELQLDAIYGARQRRRIACFSIPRMESIAPLGSSYKKERKDARYACVTEAISSPDSPGAYRAVFRGENQNLSLLFFEADEKVLKALRFLNARAFSGNF